MAGHHPVYFDCSAKSSAPVTNPEARTGLSGAGEIRCQSPRSRFVVSAFAVAASIAAIVAGTLGAIARCAAREALVLGFSGVSLATVVAAT